MMKVQKRILAWLTAILMLLPLAACTPAQENETPVNPTANTPEIYDTVPAPGESSEVVPAPEGSADAGSEGEEPFDAEPEEEEPVEENYTELFASFGTGAFDGKAVAIELGDFRITADEVRNLFDQYVINSDEDPMNRDTLSLFMRWTEEWLLENQMIEWKAKELGITLPKEQLTAFADEAQEEVDDARSQMLCTHGDPEGLATDASELTEEQEANALESIAEELTAMYGSGYTFDDYLAMLYRNALASKRIEALSALMEESYRNNAAIDKTTIDEWYEKTLAEQTELFTDDPSQYINGINGYDDADVKLCLYTPKKAARIQVVYIPTKQSDSDWLAGNKTWMADLEEEYNDLKKSGDDDEMMAEIASELAELKKENAAIEERLAVGEEETANRVYADLVNGMSFEDAMAAFENYDDEESGHFERVILLDDSEPMFPMFVETASKLSPGSFSKPVLINEQYCIVRLVEIIPEGPVDRASIESKLKAVIADEAWPTQSEAWLKDAENAAVYHRDAYAMLIAEYLD